MPKETLGEIVVRDAKERGYHPRSDRQSAAQSQKIVADLLEGCPALAERALRGEIVVQYTHHQRVGHEDWKIDIAIGTKAGVPVAPSGAPISMEAPAIVQIAIELKSIWTEHGKARKNRFRDFTAFHGHAHRYDPKTVSGAFLIVNCSNVFYSPLNRGRADEMGGPITRHGTRSKDGKATAKAAVELFRSIHLRHSENDLPGLEAMGIIVVEHDNFNVLPDELRSQFGTGIPTRAVDGFPAPQVGDPLHYQTFLQRICNQYRARFC